MPQWGISILPRFICPLREIGPDLLDRMISSHPANTPRGEGYRFGTHFSLKIST